MIKDLKKQLAMNYMNLDPYFKYVAPGDIPDCSSSIYECIICKSKLTFITSACFEHADWDKMRIDHLMTHLFDKEIKEITDELDGMVNDQED